MIISNLSIISVISIVNECSDPLKSNKNPSLVINAISNSDKLLNKFLVKILVPAINVLYNVVFPSPGKSILEKDSDGINSFCRDLIWFKFGIAKYTYLSGLRL